MSGPQMDPHAIPIIKAYIAQTQGTVLGAVTGALFLGLTLPILVALLYFSSTKSRKSFMWNLVVFAVTSGVAFALFATIALVRRSLRVHVHRMYDSRIITDQINLRPIQYSSSYQVWRSFGLYRYSQCLDFRHPASVSHMHRVPVPEYAPATVDPHHRNWSSVVYRTTCRRPCAGLFSDEPEKRPNQSGSGKNRSRATCSGDLYPVPFVKCIRGGDIPVEASHGIPERRGQWKAHGRLQRFTWCQNSHTILDQHYQLRLSW